MQAMPIMDPVSGQAALLLLQTDITSGAELEANIAALTESQLAMLEQMFPRWDGGCAAVTRQCLLGVLAFGLKEVGEVVSSST